MLIKEVRYPLLEYHKSPLKLYPHQIRLWEAWDNYSTLLLASKTGTGKTRAAMLPILDESSCAMAIYPTNELLRDQVGAVAQLAEEVGKKAIVWRPDLTESQAYSDADWVMIPVDSKLLSLWQTEMRLKSRGETLRVLLNPDKKKLVFTNPDMLFLILGLFYHAEPFEALRRYKTLVVDEFHLYQGVELAHALSMIATARGFEIFQRIVMLSATPQTDVLEILKSAFQVKIIEAKTQDEESAQYVAVHDVLLEPKIQLQGDNIDSILKQLKSKKNQFLKLMNEKRNDSYIPAVAIVNSVFSAIRLEEQVVQAGLGREHLSIIRGLSNRNIRERQGKVLAIGTSAIEVGVDFDCDHLLFEANEASTFLQRFGRVGRHRSGQAIAWVAPNAFSALKELEGSKIDRGDFERLVYSLFPQPSSSPWFVFTEHGMITARSLLENLYLTVKKSGASQNTLQTLRQRLDEIMYEHASKLNCQKQDLQSKKLFERASADKKSAQWIYAYCSLNRFRTSLPSMEVHDFVEQHRRSNWTLGDYDVDLLTLLRRGKNIKWNEKLSKLTINGIGTKRNVSATDIFTDEDCGYILQTKDYPLLAILQDGEITPVSDIFNHRNHIFCVIPQTTVISLLNWRLPTIESGKYLLAFDGAALLLLELYRRNKVLKSQTG